ncbi:MAG: DUF4013 domain-containing protein [Anaerolineales bacterium]|nr:DUF4013 domain-containing protein [Anaerolineales bacterium]
MNIGKSFSFVFDDKNWMSKLGLGALITLVPVLNLAWSGYLVGILRNVMNGSSEPLPTWDDLGKKFTDGLLLGIAGFAYTLPIIIVFCLPLSIMIVPSMLAMEDIANTVAGVGSILLACLSCFALVYMLALSAIYPAIFVIFAREGTLASCFKFRDVFDLIRQNSSPFITVWAVNLGLSFVLSIVVGGLQTVLGFIPCLGQIISVPIMFIAIVYVSAVSFHLFGQFGREIAGSNAPISIA